MTQPNSAAEALAAAMDVSPGYAQQYVKRLPGNTAWERIDWQLRAESALAELVSVQELTEDDLAQIAARVGEDGDLAAALQLFIGQRATAKRMADAAQRVVDAAPPLTPEQRDRLAILLRGSAAPTDSEKSMAGRIAAHVSWANTPDRSARTAPARAALDEKFLRDADGDPTRADHLRKAHFARMALRSAQSRRAKSRRRDTP